MSDMIFQLLLFSCPLIALSIFFISRLVSTRKASRLGEVIEDGKAETGDPYQDIQPLYDFDWSTTPPIRIRPFKPKYHLTMGMQETRSQLQL